MKMENNIPEEIWISEDPRTIGLWFYAKRIADFNYTKYIRADINSQLRIALKEIVDTTSPKNPNNDYSVSLAAEFDALYCEIINIATEALQNKSDRVDTNTQLQEQCDSQLQEIEALKGKLEGLKDDVAYIVKTWEVSPQDNSIPHRCLLINEVLEKCTKNFEDILV